MKQTHVYLQNEGKEVDASNPLPVKLDGATGTELLAQLTALNTAIGTGADVAGANTVIGQLKQIAANTAA